MRKRGVLQLALQRNFWVVGDTCNSLYLYVLNVNKQVTWVVELQLTIYMVQLITIQLQLYQNNSFSITMQLHYNYTHDVMLTSLIIIHLLKFDTWHYGDFWTLKKNINLHCSLWLLMMVRDYDMWHNKFFVTWHIKVYFGKSKYVF
jgi:hypothetical protein